MVEVAAVLGVLGAAVGVADTVPYIRDMRRGTTRPHRGTWLVWTVLAVGALVAHAAEGPRWSLVMLAAQVVLTAIVLMLSMRHGMGGLGRADVVMLAMAGAGIVGWIVAGDPVVATVCIIAADIVGIAMMTPKAWRDPWSETSSTFALASLSGLCAVGAVGSLEPSLLLYPIYYALANGALALVLRTRTARLGVAPRLAPGRSIG